MTDTLTYPEGTEVLITDQRLLEGLGLPSGTTATVLENWGHATAAEVLLASIVGINVQEGDEKLELTIGGCSKTYSSSSREVELVPAEVTA